MQKEKHKKLEQKVPGYLTCKTSAAYLYMQTTSSKTHDVTKKKNTQKEGNSANLDHQPRLTIHCPKFLTAHLVCLAAAAAAAAVEFVPAPKFVIVAVVKVKMAAV